MQRNPSNRLKVPLLAIVLAGLLGGGWTDRGAKASGPS
jgi:hypothetical protein